MTCWDYYAKTIDRVVWSGEVAGSHVRNRVEQILTERPELRRIASIDHPAGETLPPEFLSPRTIVVRGAQRGDLGQCPGTHGHLCCNYLTLNVYLGCTLGCTYCIMQSYLRNRTIEVHLPDAGTIADIRSIAAAQPSRLVRIGTGEVGDSLLYDPLFGISEDLITAFSDLSNLRFEVKTKTDYIDHLPGVGAAAGAKPGAAAGAKPGAEPGAKTGAQPAATPRRNTVVAFSLNPPTVINDEEGAAATLDARISAARRAVDAGYRTAFHFDPMIHIDDWRDAYGAVVDRLAAFRDAPPDWISLGTLRYPPPLKEWIERRRYAIDEFVQSRDGKMRYLQPIRAEMYRFVKARIRATVPNTPVYLCMESPTVWRSMQGAAGGDERPLRDIMRPVVLGGVE